MQRTIKLQLNTTPTTENALNEAIVNTTQAFNYLCNYGWKEKVKNNVKLQHACYYPLKALIPGMPSQLLIAACHKAAEALKATFSHLKLYPAKVEAWKRKKAAVEAKGKIFKRRMPRPPSCPKSQNCPVRYDMRSYWVKWDKAEASFATPQGRTVVGFAVPQYYEQYTGFPTASADLICRKGKFWLHVVVNLPENEFQDNGETIGVDLGLNHPAVTSNRKFHGPKRWKEIARRKFQLKRALQSKGTKSATKHLRKLNRSLTRFKRDCDHVLSKRIVQSATPGTTIVIEDLSEIRETTEQRGRESRRRLHSWTFAQFRSFLSYKAEAAGMRVVAIDPRHTSQTCSSCGFQYRHNRKSQSLFRCRSCGYQLNADLNAAYNIRDKHHASLGISLAGGLPSYNLSSQSSD